MQIRFYEDSNFGKSDRRFYEDRLRSGRVRSKSGLVLDLAVVADGIGGENAGERAAEMTIEEVFAYAKASEDKDIVLLLQTALELANAKVYLEAQHERHKQDMGSTAAVAAVHDGRLYIANIGDSRIYLVRGRQITQLTWDHTWGNEMVREGQMTVEEVSRNYQRDDLMRSIGYEPQVMVDTGLYAAGEINEQKARHQQGLRLRPGDRVVVCSDGLIKARRKEGGCFVEPEEIVKILAEGAPEESAKLLVDKALERGTDDNVSVIVIQVPSRLRPVYIPKPARIAFTGLLALGLIALGVMLPVLRQPPAPPTLPPMVISQNQAYISKVTGPSLQFLPVQGEARQVLDGEFVDFISGAVLQTGPAQEGYVFVGLPGRAELFIAADSEIRFISSDHNRVAIQLQSGRAVIKLDENFPEGRSVVVFSPDWARTWISGSSMCVWIEPPQDFHMECVEHSCGYEDKGQRFIPAGFHVSFEGSPRAASGAGLHSEMCQFVPGLVPTATPTVTPTQRSILPKPALYSTATPRFRLPFFPTLIPFRSATPRPLIPTATRTPIPTWTPIPPPTHTNTPLPTDTPIPTDTFTPIPTDTNTPVPTDTNTPVPPTDTNTPVPTPVPPTDTPVTPTDTFTPQVSAQELTPTATPDGSLSSALP